MLLFKLKIFHLIQVRIQIDEAAEKILLSHLIEMFGLIIIVITPIVRNELYIHVISFNKRPQVILIFKTSNFLTVMSIDLTVVSAHLFLCKNINVGLEKKLKSINFVIIFVCEDNFKLMF